jgi:hypothetical protein
VVVVVAISASAAEVTSGLQTRIHWGTEAQRHRGTGTGGQRTFLLRRQHRAVQAGDERHNTRCLQQNLVTAPTTLAGQRSNLHRFSFIMIVWSLIPPFLFP